jgi:hypothetical protein
MDLINNSGEKIGSMDVAVSAEKVVTIQRAHDVTIVNTRDRTTGEVKAEIFYGDSPYGG